MLSKEKIARINELSRKSKAEGLTAEEIIEQQGLRKEYIQTFRNSMTDTLHNVKIVDSTGADVTPDKLKKSKNQRLN
jgi:uncharacterized protein YnzC (UPF0291/DUF896 family)